MVWFDLGLIYTPRTESHDKQLYCTTKDPVLASQFKAAMLEFNKQATNDAFTAALKTEPTFASLCTIAGLVSFDFSVPLANAAANIGALVCLFRIRTASSIGTFVRTV